MFAFALQLLDNFLLQYNLGQVLVVVYVLALLAALAQRSAKIVAIQTVAFGLIFVLVPSINGPTHYLYVGLALLIVAPMVYVSADQ